MKFCKVCYSLNGEFNSSVIENPNVDRRRHEYLCERCHKRGVWTAATCRTFLKYGELSDGKILNTSSLASNPHRLP